VAAWGDNQAGQTSVPAGLARATAIAAGGKHSLALLTNGTVVAWGENVDALGNYVGQSTVPPGLNNAVTIAAGAYHSLAALSNGTVRAWGDNSGGQSEVPAGLGNVVALSGGGAHTLALSADGTVAAWGINYNGQLALPPGLSNIIAVAAGDSHSLVLVGDLAARPKLLWPARHGSQFVSLVPTLPGKIYTLEAESSLSGAGWTGVNTTRGSGGLQFFFDPAASLPQKWYRVRQR